MGRVIILPETTKNPITLIGKRAGYCYGADVTDENKNLARGFDCIERKHFRCLEYVNVEMILEGYSARVIREWYTHIGGGPTRLQASTRRINYKDFPYVVPDSIKEKFSCEAIYKDCMRYISESLQRLEEAGVPREDAALLLPLGMETTIVDKRNLRNLVDMSRQRMCSKAYHEYRDLFNDILTELAKVSEEWESIIRDLMHPKCEETGFCTEKDGCGRRPEEY